MGNVSDRELEQIFKAVANRRRVAILRYLKKKKEAAVGDIAEQIKLSFRSTSKHLTLLSAAGIVAREQRGLQMFYRIAHDASASIHTILSLV